MPPHQRQFEISVTKKPPVVMHDIPDFNCMSERPFEQIFPEAP